MKCLTVRQPWAHAIIHLGKDVENRSWPTSYRGPLLIHAGSRRDPALCRQLGLNPDDLTYGAVIGIVDVVDCVRNSTSEWAEPDQYHWILENPRPLSGPIPLKGRLGLFEVSADVLERGGKTGDRMLNHLAFA